MADIDPETIERVAGWCAEAGRQTVASEIRRALAPLSWDELLSVKAMLADPPPARPLGPHALADIARGAPPDVAAEREREGRYRSEEHGEEPRSPESSAGAEEAATPRPRRRTARPRAAQVVIRRARDRASAAPEPPPERPLLDDLRVPEGRAELERLLRRHGGRRSEILRELAARWRGPDGAAPSDPDLDALLDHHGLARAFRRRERDELLHALRAEGGVRAAAAARVGLDAEALDAAFARLDATRAAEEIREERRAELRARATLSERVRLVVGAEARLRDLGLLEEFEADLRARLPEHVRALRAGGGPLDVALGRSFSMPPGDAAALAARFDVDLGGRREASPAPHRGSGAARAGAPVGRRMERDARRKAPPRSRSRGGKPGPGKGPRPPRKGARGRGDRRR